jgi:hypothetical protein
MITCFLKINRLVDICNGREGDKITKSGRRSDTEKINHPKHRNRHILELFDVLCTGEEWKKECGGFNKKFITQQSYEDFRCLVFGIAGIAVSYLKEDGSL